MCFGDDGNKTSPIAQLFADLKLVASNLQFIFVFHGVLLPIIILLGVVLNATCLVVLCRKSLRSAPYCLLQCLTVCDLLIMLFAIYSDVEPAIRAKIHTSSVLDNLVLDCDALGERLLNDVQMFQSGGLNLAMTNYSQRAKNGTATVISLDEVDGDINDFLLLLLLQDLASQSEQANQTKKNPFHRTHALDSSHTPGELQKPKLQQDLNFEKATNHPQAKPDTLNAKYSKGENRLQPLWNENLKNIDQRDLLNAPPKNQHKVRNLETRHYKHIDTTVSSNSSSLIHETESKPGKTSVDSLDKADNKDLNSSSLLHGIEINTQPILQAFERWFAYNLMTFNLAITFVMAIERLLAISHPFRARTLLSTRRIAFVIGCLVTLTLALHTPQFLKEVIISIKSPEKLKDDFQGKMLQSFRQVYERVVVYLTSAILVLVLITNLFLIRALAGFKAKVKFNRQAGNKQNVDVNITVAVIVLVFLQLPHSIAMNILSTISMEGFHAKLTSFTISVVVIRVLYVTNSAFNCVTYCFLSKLFRQHFLTIYGPCLPECMKTKGSNQGQAVTKSSSLSPSRVSLASVNKLSHHSLDLLATEQEVKAILAKQEGKMH